MKMKGICIAAAMAMAMALCLGGCQGKAGDAKEALPDVSSEIQQGEGAVSANGEETPDDGAASDREADESEAGLGDGTEENPSDGNKLFEDAVLNGQVTEISETQCMVNRTQEFEEGTAVSAADGTVDEENQAAVVWQEECLFQFVEINRSTHKLTYTPADRNSLEQWDSIIVYGTSQEDNVFYADRIYIYTFVS